MTCLIRCRILGPVVGIQVEPCLEIICSKGAAIRDGGTVVESETRDRYGFAPHIFTKIVLLTHFFVGR